MTHEATPRQVKIYDTMSRAKRIFEPIDPACVGLYVCGVTVYDLTHIGHARTFICFDVVQRFLRHIGYTVRFVRNHTDVDDKIIRRAAERGVDPLALAQEYIDAFDQDMGALYVQSADVEPRVSTHIPQIIETIQTLIAKNVAYVTDAGDVFYRVRSFDNYGKLSHRRLEDMEAGRSGRVDDDDLHKEHPFDFALWKSVKPGEPSWESPWGAGRPGWHIECSAMSVTHLGHTFDIHGGGQDLAFPHHENEIAQSEACTGHTLCNTWMHVAMLNIDGTKMSKSLNNFWTTRDVLEQAHPEAIRLFMYGTHYRHPINYSREALDEATRHIVYFYEALRRAQETLLRAETHFGDEPPTDDWHDARRGQAIEAFMGRFEDAMADDFNTSLAISLLHEQVKWANELTQSKKRPKEPAVRSLLAIVQNIRDAGALLAILQREPAHALTELRDLAVRSLGLDTTLVEQKIAQRDQARQDRDWAAADRLRDELLAMQVEIMDSPDGTTWRIHYAEPAATEPLA